VSDVTWKPNPRPEWVEAVNRGDIWPMADVASAPFTLEHLTGEVGARLGVTASEVVAQLGDDSLEALEVLLPSLEHEARLSVLGRWITHRFLGRITEQRLALDAYVRRDPGVLDEQIVEPWFVVGAPRTGTTILHGLLAQDPNHRVPLGWELLSPAPPPALSGDVEARVALADAELRTPQVVSSGLVAIHDYSGRMYKECLSAMSFVFRSEEFVARYDVPTYEAWLHQADMHPAYDMHRRVLQVLQRGAEPKRWVLKTPVHLQNLPTLLEVYPDARLSATHRDLMSVMPSLSSLVATLRSAHSDHVDAGAIGRYHVELYAGTLDRFLDLIDTGRLDPARLTHSRHVDFLDDAIGVVRSLYGHFGWELTPAAEAAMTAYLDDHAEGAAGGHRYDLASFGLGADEVRARFARYAERFGVTPTR
jgi:sulfotransferase family protein